MLLLEKALGRNIVMPKRKIHSMEELLEVCHDVKDLFIDGTERKTQRPKKGKLKTKRYSGKKKMHSRKNTIISDEKRKIIYVSPTKEGKIHDLRQLKKAGVLEHIPPDITLWLDKRYVGIKKNPTK
jgi:DDE superfamily endonuclease